MRLIHRCVHNSRLDHQHMNERSKFSQFVVQCKDWNAHISQLFRFGVVGISSTLLHVILATSLIKLFSTTQVFANCNAFLCATIFSYIAHTKWSFGSVITKKTMARFSITIGICFGLTYIISSFAQSINLPYQIGIFLIVTTVPICSYLLHRFWTYR